jgi:hypothetical protein
MFYCHKEYLRTFEIFYDHLLHFVLIWCIFSGFGILWQEKSGNPGMIRGNSLWKARQPGWRARAHLKVTTDFRYLSLVLVSDPDNDLLCHQKGIKNSEPQRAEFVQQTK